MKTIWWEGDDNEDLKIMKTCNDNENNDETLKEINVNIFSIGLIS